MLYVLYSTSNSDYQSWQCRLLEWSFKKVNQSGKLIRLCSFNSHAPDRKFDISEISEVIKLPDYRTRWTLHTQNIDKDYGIVNKTESLKFWLKNYQGLNDEDNVLFLDPDMVFLKNVNFRTNSGTIIGQRWLDRGIDKSFNFRKYGTDILDKINPENVFMYPYLSTVRDLKKIIERYTTLCYQMRLENYPNLWEAEMFALIISSLESEGLSIKTLDNFGLCTTWHYNDLLKNSSLVNDAYLLHYPGDILDKTNNRIFNKQYYTQLTLKENWDRVNSNEATSLVERKFLQVLNNYNLDKKINFYWKNIDWVDSLSSYTPQDKYLVYKPWKGGFNNVRMSLESAAAIAFIQNRILVIPEEYRIYLQNNVNNISDFFDIEDLGIKTISFAEFKIKFNLNTWENVKEISYEIKDEIVHTLFHTDEKNIPDTILHGRTAKNLNDFVEEKIIVFDSNLLCNFYLGIYSNLLPEICKYVARHIHYKYEIFYEAYKVIEELNEYYAIHIRRNDYQYKDLWHSAEEIYNNIKHIIPEHSKLYISTDEKDKSFFNVLKLHYNVHFYEDIKHIVSIDLNPDLIGPVEQIICTEAITFIGCRLSTFSSYIYRLRGYMNHIKDKRFLTYQRECQPDKEEDEWWVASWAREYDSVWKYIENVKHFNISRVKKHTIFVSIASYRDTQLIDTINSLLKNKSGENEIIIGVCMQDTEENYNNFPYKNTNNIKIHFIPYQEAKGVGYARHYIQQNLFNNEDYFLQIDSHSRAIKNWDSILIEQINMCESQKSILSTYPNGFDVNDEKETFFEHNSCPYLKMSGISNVSKKINCVSGGVVNNTPLLGFWIAAGFLFTKGIWCKEVEYSKDLYFTGEEDHLSIMSYLNEWDVYAPPSSTIWHDYTDNRIQSPKKYRPLHWEDHKNHNDNIHMLKELHNGYGKSYKRTVDDFLTFAKKLSNIGTDTENLDIEIVFDYADIPVPVKDVLAIIFVFCDKDGNEIFRPDIYEDDIIKRLKNKKIYTMSQEIYDKIDYCIWYYKYTDDTFGDRLELTISKKNNRMKIFYF